MKPNKPTYQVALDALALTTCYPAFLITAEVPVIYMYQFWATVTKRKSSYRFKIDNKKFSVNVKVFRDILNICPKIQGQEFDEPPTKKEALSFIRELGAEPPKSKKSQKKLDSAISYEGYPSKKKSTKAKKVTATKPKPTKKKATVKADRGKGLNVLSEVALSEAAQLNEVTKRSNKNFHISQASGSGDGTDFESGVPDEQHRRTSGTNEGTGTIPGVPDVPKYDSESEKESWGDSREEDEDDENDSEDKSDDGDDDDDDGNDGNDGNDGDYDDANNDDNQEEEEEIDDEETMDDEEDDEVTKELYKDVNVNLGNEDTKMTDADQGGSKKQNKADEPVKSSSVSSDFTSKLLNLENPSLTNNEIASLMETSARHAMDVPEIISVFTSTIPPPPPFFNPLPQQATPTPTPTTSEATISFPSLLDFSYVFKFNDRVTNLEKDLSEIKQVDQQEAQDEKNEYIGLVDTSMRTILKEEVNAQLPQILPQAVLDFAIPVIQKNITKSLEAAVLARSSSQPKSTYEMVASLFQFELTKILIDKMKKNKSYDKADYKRELYDALVKSYQTDKDLFDTYGEVFTLKRSRDGRDKDQDPSAGSDRETK
ncbi:hypothetical protein Tco_1208057, partial [Tanacetum coccineum]